LEEAMKKKKSGKSAAKFKLNWLDFLIIFASLAISAVVIRFGGKFRAPKTPAHEATVRYVIEFMEMDEDAPKLLQIGDEVEVTSNGRGKANIINVDVEPFKKAIFSEDTSSFVMAEYPGKVNIFVELEGRGLETDEKITIGDAVIAVGESGLIRGLGYSFRSYIIEAGCKY
jgi:hypothetical protein